MAGANHIRYFIDESGHSGDLTNSGNQYDFNEQPIFVLAYVGIDNEPELNLFPQVSQT